MTTNPAFESDHPRADDGRFAVKRADEAVVGAGGVNLAEPVHLSPTYADAAVASIQVIGALRVVYGRPGEHQPPEMAAVMDEAVAAMEAYENRDADRAATAARLRTLAGPGMGAVRREWPHSEHDHVAETLNRIADQIEGKPVDPETGCSACFGRGEVATGQVEHDTGAPVVVACSACSGEGVVPVATIEEAAREDAVWMQAPGDRWYADDFDASPTGRSLVAEQAERWGPSAPGDVPNGVPGEWAENWNDEPPF